MKIFNPEKNGVRTYVLFTHVLIGVLVFYFLLHPLTMIIYWFEMNATAFSVKQFFEIAPARIFSSFSFRMTGMSVAFICMGGLTGLGSGLYYRKILEKSNILARQGEQLKKNVISIIEGGENDKVEFKSSLRYDYHQNTTNKSLEEVIVKTISGFLNTNGGELIIGIDDNKNILGLQQDYYSLNKKNRDGFELRIYQLITNEIGIEFCSKVQLEFYELEEKDICVLRIEPSQSPAYVSGNNKTAFYIRAGNSTKPLNIKEAVNYIETKK